jgi:alpha-D-ribose 1-methylphosphonate 5-triphosphate synthase subunit PhnI
VAPAEARSTRLSTLAGAETSGLVQLWALTMADSAAPRPELSLREVRHRRLPVVVDHPGTGEPVTIGHIRVTKAEVVEVLDGHSEGRLRLKAGYGVGLGHNDRKAIAMAYLDVSGTAWPLTGSGEAGADADAGAGPSAAALIEQLRRPGGCGVGSACGFGG